MQRYSVPARAQGNQNRDDSNTQPSTTRNRIDWMGKPPADRSTLPPWLVTSSMGAVCRQCVACAKCVGVISCATTICHLPHGAPLMSARVHLTRDGAAESRPVSRAPSLQVFRSSGAPSPAQQGRFGVGSLFSPKIKSFTPSQPPPARRGRSKSRSARAHSQLNGDAALRRTGPTGAIQRLQPGAKYLIFPWINWRPSRQRGKLRGSADHPLQRHKSR